MCPLLGQGGVPAPPGGFGADLAHCSTAVEEAYPGNLPPHNWFTEDERKSRRKPWRFYGAWAVTSARSAGGFRGSKLTLFRRDQFWIDAVYEK